MFTTKFTTSITYEDHFIEVLFVRRNSDPISGDNISELLDVHSVQGSPLEGLYNSLKGVWCPALLENREWSNKLPPKVMQLLTELQSALGDSNRSNDSKDSIDLDNTFGINEPSDELRFWFSLKDNRQFTCRNFAKAVDNAFTDINTPGFGDIESLDMNGLSDLATRSLDVLNNVWMVTTDNMVFPQRRMMHVFNCMGGAF